MLYPNLLARIVSYVFKGIVPFAVAITLGLFVASFFVSIVPSFKSSRGGGRLYRLWQENQQLQMDKQELKSQIEELKRTYPDCKSDSYKNLELSPLEEAPPPPPKWEKRLKEKFERLEKNR